jgi:hypothetical protein
MTEWVAGLVLACMALSGCLMTDDMVIPSSARKPHFGLQIDYGGTGPNESKVLTWSATERAYVSADGSRFFVGRAEDVLSGWDTGGYADRSSAKGYYVAQMQPQSQKAGGVVFFLLINDVTGSKTRPVYAGKTYEFDADRFLTHFIRFHCLRKSPEMRSCVEAAFGSDRTVALAAILGEENGRQNSSRALTGNEVWKLATQSKDVGVRPVWINTAPGKWKDVAREAAEPVEDRPSLHTMTNSAAMESSELTIRVVRSAPAP